MTCVCRLINTNPVAASIMDATELANIRIVLVSPIYGGNVGSVCRAMRNMGLSDLVVAAPRPLDEDEGMKMACGARELFARRKTAAGLAEAVADCSLVVGATARRGLYRQQARTPRDWTDRILQGAQVGRVALVFGPEDNGLGNKDLALCTQLIQIPSSREHSSLNLAQAVMVCCYEIYLASGLFEAQEEKSPEAPSALRERMFGLWRKALLDVGFMKEDKADHMMFGLRRILARGPLSTDDVRILMGIARQMQWCAGRMRGNEECSVNTE